MQKITYEVILRNGMRLEVQLFSTYNVEDVLNSSGQFVQLGTHIINTKEILYVRTFTQSRSSLRW
jgi:hypothetical protein